MENFQSLADKFLSISIATAAASVLFRSFKKLEGGKETDPAATLESADEDRGLKICDAFGDPLYVIGLRDFVHMDSSDTISTEELLKYKEEIAKTGGFDVDPPPNAYLHGVIQPVSDWDLEEGSEVLEMVKSFSKVAIDSYNNYHKKAFKFEKVVKSAWEMCCFLHYITFEAKEEDQPPETFQAVVEARETMVKSCWIKPKK
ncbi:hypothetical protein Vadar_007173 [Vaccinium darrowii]|uniref:Uncharacterized protein n=1 Tax=Vaccinium darrowii TaxID=229202 RepID=A0ACB7WZ07_9ERIC|nr:hypothetical protein Vadar_007173 [Vaccinium darrowii]